MLGSGGANLPEASAGEPPGPTRAEAPEAGAEEPRPAPPLGEATTLADAGTEAARPAEPAPVPPSSSPSDSASASVEPTPAGGGASSADAQSVDDTLAVVQKRYATIRDISAEFEQEARVASLGRTDRTRGQVRIKRPGRMRWEYAPPEPRVITVDGENLRMYLPEEQQLQIASLNSAGAFPPTALEFLLGDGDLRASFTAERIAQERDGEIGLRLTPRQDASFDHLEIWVSAERYQLRESVVTDLFGNRTSVRFRDVQENRGIDEKLFEIEVPEGTEVFDLRE